MVIPQRGIGRHPSRLPAVEQIPEDISPSCHVPDDVRRCHAALAAGTFPCFATATTWDDEGPARALVAEGLHVDVPHDVDRQLVGLPQGNQAYEGDSVTVCATGSYFAVSKAIHPQNGGPGRRFRRL